MHQLWGPRAVKFQDAKAYSSVYGLGPPNTFLTGAGDIVSQLEQSHRKMSPAPLRARSRRPSSQASLDIRRESSQSDTANPANAAEVPSDPESTPPRSCEGMQTRASTPAVGNHSPILRLREPHAPEAFFKEFHRCV